VTTATPEQLASIALGVAKDFVKRNLLAKNPLERDRAKQELAEAIVASIRSQYELVPKGQSAVQPPVHR
jgi:hypothetical protein